MPAVVGIPVRHFHFGSSGPLARPITDTAAAEVGRAGSAL